MPWPSVALARPPSATTAAHPFVGRGELLDALFVWLERARDGKGAAVLLVGETGIGKSAVAGTLSEEARRGGFVVLEGRAQPREIPQPFETIKEALRGLTPGQLRGSEGPDGALRSIWTPERHAPTSLLPLGLMAWRGPEGPATEPSSSEEGPDRVWASLDRAGAGVEEDRLALFDRLFQTLANVAHRQPLLLVLEDVHFADSTTLEFAKFLIRHAPGLPLGVMLTSLPLEELAAPSREVLESLGREGGLEVHSVRPFNMDEVRDYLRWLNADQPPDPDTVTRLFAESEGNPLFLERLARGERGRAVRGGGSGESASPTEGPRADRVREEPSRSSRNRGKVSELAEKLLAYGALLGDEFPFAALAKVAEGDEEEVARSLERLVRSGVLEELPDERYRFREEEERQRLLSMLTETRRRRMHRRLAEVMEVLGPGPRGEEAWVRDLSVHFHLGRHDLRSFEYNTRLFHVARHAGRVSEAREALERALESVQRLPPTEKEHREQEREVLLRLGEVLAEAGELRRSEERLMDAFTMFLPAEPHEAVQLALARTHLHQGKYTEARRRVQGLLPAPHETRPSITQIEASGLLAEAALALGDLDEALARADGALRFAEGQPDLVLLGDACRRLGDYYLEEHEETDRARALYARALRVFEDGGDELRKVRLGIPLAELDFLRKRTEEGFRRLQNVSTWGEEHGARLVHAEALLRESHHALNEGALDRSESAMESARQLVPPVEGPRFELPQAILAGRHAHHRGDHEKARSHLAHAEELARVHALPRYLFEVLLARAEGEIARGERTAARATLEEAQHLGVRRSDLQRRWRELHQSLGSDPA
ncbi:MAG: AAA family ATPase [Euryarchaeota archaeon]|nr:AAA family ATPase [Euryarchaeota archaeon]MDE1837013.1 AAA family ATPase [Euryarchaeota archaeon]MDE1879863.1 AAA family ATPase [Euryarchaeota archaeon]MDE2045671.1 AAA family ATPase [Thermoplasmata archaeon]